MEEFPRRRHAPFAAQTTFLADGASMRLPRENAMPNRFCATGTLAALVLCLAIGFPPSTHAVDHAAVLIDEIIRAEGGLRAATAIPALQYDLHIKETTYEADATYVVDRKGRMRIDVYMDGKRVVTECYDGHKGWEMDGNGIATTASAEGASALWRGTQYPGQILALTELPAHGHVIRAVEPETIDGVAYDVLELTMSDGFKTYRYADPRSHLIVRGRDTRPLHIDIDPTDALIETVWSDFRTVDSVQRPFVSTQADLRSGKWLQTTTVKSIRKLRSLPDRLFAFGAAAEGR